MRPLDAQQNQPAEYDDLVRNIVAQAPELSDEAVSRLRVLLHGTKLGSGGDGPDRREAR